MQLIGATGIRVDQTPQADLCAGSPFYPGTEARQWGPIGATGIGEPEPIADIGKQVMSHATGALDLMASIEESLSLFAARLMGRLTVEMITAVLACHVGNGASVPFPLSIPDNPLGKWTWAPQPARPPSPHLLSCAPSTGMIDFPLTTHHPHPPKENACQRVFGLLPCSPRPTCHLFSRSFCHPSTPRKSSASH